MFNEEAFEEFDLEAKIDDAAKEEAMKSIGEVVNREKGGVKWIDMSDHLAWLEYVRKHQGLNKKQQFAGYNALVVDGQSPKTRVGAMHVATVARNQKKKLLRIQRKRVQVGDKTYTPTAQRSGGSPRETKGGGSEGVRTAVHAETRPLSIACSTLIWR